jgi:hypothetical protein
MSWEPIRADLNDELLKRQLVDQLDKAQATGDIRILRECADLLVESYVQSRVAAKYLGREAARNLGTMSQFPLSEQ